jgi:hypothetical protein
MAFGFFKRRGGKPGASGDRRFDADQDEVGFDELDSSGEFIVDGRNPPPPMPEPAPSLPPRTPPPPSGPVAARPFAPTAPSAPPPPPPRPTPQAFDDLTILDPRRVGPGVPAAAPPPPPPPPADVRPPTEPALGARPAAPMVRPPVPARTAPPPPPGLDDKTMLMPGPTGNKCVVAWLVVARGTFLGKDYRLPGGTARIGIDDGCDIRLLGDTYVSSRHAEICYRQGQYELRDLNSTNGTFVNDVRVSEAILRDNDRVRLGETHLVFTSLSL